MDRIAFSALLLSGFNFEETGWSRSGQIGSPRLIIDLSRARTISTVVIADRFCGFGRQFSGLIRTKPRT